MDLEDFARCGDNVIIHPGSTFIGADAIEIGSHVLISEMCWLLAGLGLRIGNYVHIANHVSIAGGGEMLIGDFAGLSAGSRVVTGTDVIDGSGLTNPMVPKEYRSVTRERVVLGRHAFLGTNAVVHPGVTIGEGAVVGSGAVVVRDIEPWTINVGIPARPVGERPSAKMKELEARVYEENGVTPFV